MVRQMTATQVKVHILGLLDEVADGDEIEITKHGRTIARLVPARGVKSLKGKFAGVAISAVPDEALFATDVQWNLP